MLLNLSADYIAHRMQVLGHGTSYTMQYRHYVIRTANPIEIETSGDVYFLVGDVENITIESAMGIYDLSNTYLSEQLHEHTGKITINNTSSGPAHLRMIQVTPLHPTINESTEHASTI